MRSTETIARSARRPAPATPHRATLALVLSVLAVAGASGGVQLMTGTYTPPFSDLEPLGLTSWLLPGVWLVFSVAVPSCVAAWTAWRRWAVAPELALVAAALLGVELVVQIPFVGPSLLQLVLGAVAVVIACLAVDSRRRGWRRGPAAGA